mgnify:CR=1 FL=1
MSKIFIYSEDVIENEIFEFVKKKLDLNPENIQKLKDLCMITDEGLKVLISFFPGLTCTYNEYEKHNEKLFQIFLKELKPFQTRDGYSLNVSRAEEFMKFSYPEILEEEQNQLGSPVDTNKVDTKGRSPNHKSFNETPK